MSIQLISYSPHGAVALIKMQDQLYYLQPPFDADSMQPIDVAAASLPMPLDSLNVEKNFPDIETLIRFLDEEMINAIKQSTLFPISSKIVEDIELQDQHEQLLDLLIQQLNQLKRQDPTSIDLASQLARKLASQATKSTIPPVSPTNLDWLAQALFWAKTTAHPDREDVA